jgi:hypothetical protein
MKKFHHKKRRSHKKGRQSYFYVFCAFCGEISSDAPSHSMQSAVRGAQFPEEVFGANGQRDDRLQAR